MKTRLNNVFLPTSFTVVNNIEQYCYTRFRLNNVGSKTLFNPISFPEYSCSGMTLYITREQAYSGHRIGRYSRSATLVVSLIVLSLTPTHVILASTTGSFYQVLVGVIDDESLVKTRTNICLSYASAVPSHSVLWVRDCVQSC